MPSFFNILGAIIDPGRDGILVSPSSSSASGAILIKMHQTQKQHVSSSSTIGVFSGWSFGSWNATTDIKCGMNPWPGEFHKCGSRTARSEEILSIVITGTGVMELSRIYFRITSLV